MGQAKRDRAVLLSGMMGSGKSSVGRALADCLGWEFIDTDERVEAACGLKIDYITISTRWRPSRITGVR